MSVFSNLLGGGSVDTSKEQGQISNLAGRQADLGQTLLGALSTADRTGVWDPNAQLALLRQDSQYDTGLNAGNAAAAARTLGYRPGDTGPIGQQQAIQNGAALDYARQANAIRQNSILGRLSAYNSTLGNVGGLYGQAGGLYGSAANLRHQDAQLNASTPGLSSLIGGITPFLMPGFGAAKAVGSAASSYNPYASSPSTNPYGPIPSSPALTGFSMPYLAN